MIAKLACIYLRTNNTPIRESFYKANSSLSVAEGGGIGRVPSGLGHSCENLPERLC